MRKQKQFCLVMTGILFMLVYYLFAIELSLQAQPDQQSDEYCISPLDLLEINIQDAPELSGTYKVSNDGTILLLFLKRIKAQGKTTYELASFISDGLRGRYLKNPKVEISVKQEKPLKPPYRIESDARGYFQVAGEVNAPGEFPYLRGVTLKQALALAQGRTSKASNEVAIFRTNPDTGRRSEIRGDIDKIMRGKKKDIAIQPGDLIMVLDLRQRSIGDALRRAFPNKMPNNRFDRRPRSESRMYL